MESFRPWAEEIEDVLKRHSGQKESGLSSEQVQINQEIYGKNILKAETPVNKFILFLKEFNNPMSYTLLGASVLAIFLGEVVDAIAITAILLLNATIAYFQQAKASSALAALKKLSVPQSRVMRNGYLLSVPSQEIVPGDIIHLEAGDFVSADARVIEAYQLSSDEAALTGESTPVGKSTEVVTSDSMLGDRLNMLHAGTAINNGSAKAVVTATGMLTEIGQIAGLLENTKLEETPLQKRLTGVTKKLLLLGLVVIFLVVILRYFEGDNWSLIIMSAISLAVAAIPEGLPTVVTLALTLAIKRMTKRHAIVRHMSAVETLGSTDVICTDKTGTLTTGVMSVRSTFFLDQESKKNFLEAIILCNNATIDHGGTGDSTEKALLEYSQQEGLSIKEIRSIFPRLHEWSFDSDRKRMSVAVKANGETIIFVKGAPESMLGNCHLSHEDLSKLKDQIQRFTSIGQRLLAVAFKKGEVLDDAMAVEKDLTFLGLVAMADPPKSETIPAISECQKAGIKVVMITGDHPVTAKAIALELGIALPNVFDEVLTGHELDKLDLKTLQEKVERTAVYARVSPSHKLKIVEALQNNGHTVAMTGDGVNDAPALKKAQIGVSMGRAGTEVARQASSMILTDDNFATIVSAVEEGRAIYGNIRRTILYLLSTNFAEILIVLGASILGLPMPFTPVGLLWINLVTDGMPSLALAAEPLDKNILVDSPRPSPSSFFDTKFLQQIVMMGLLMTLLCLGIYYYWIMSEDAPRAKSQAFMLLVFMSLFTSFACRSDIRPIYKLKANYYHLASVFFPMILQVWLQHLTIFQKLFDIVPLSLSETGILLLIAIVPVTGTEMIKIFANRKRIS